VFFLFPLGTWRPGGSKLRKLSGGFRRVRVKNGSFRRVMIYFGRFRRVLLYLFIFIGLNKKRKINKRKKIFNFFIFFLLTLKIKVV
jgi:hypothetical protein